MLFEFVQILYWLSLATWFGAVLFVLFAPPIILRTVKANKPILPHVLSVNLDGQHSTLLAGSIVGDLLTILMPAQFFCLITMAIAIIAQWFLLNAYASTLLPPLLRSAMFIAAAVLVIYDWRYVWPRTFKSRQDYLDNADDPERANPALDDFDRYQAESLTILRIVFCLLLGIVLFSADIRPNIPHDMVKFVQ